MSHAWRINGSQIFLLYLGLFHRKPSKMYLLFSAMLFCSDRPQPPASYCSLYGNIAIEYWGEEGLARAMKQEISYECNDASKSVYNKQFLSFERRHG